MDILTPERLFSDPPLATRAPIDLQFVPRQDCIAYRLIADDDRERMDLWIYDISTQQHSVFCNANDVLGDAAHRDATQLTDAERAERERKRQFNFGITSHTWLADGSGVLLPIDGQAYLVDFFSREARGLCPPDTRQSQFTLSPNNKKLSYVRDANLYVLDIESGEETQVTHDGGALVSNGLPDFLAAEEMHRFTGHWWLPDNATIAYCRVDEQPVAESFRLEMQAQGTQTIPQRYPYAGETNPEVSLHLHHLETSECALIWEASADWDDVNNYLARVIPGDGCLYIQTQDRRQQALQLSRYRLEDAQWLTLYSEQSDTWVNLHDDLHVIGPDTLVVSDEVQGARQLVLLSLASNGLVTKRLEGPAHINAVCSVNQQAAWVTGWHKTPIENHLFRVELDGSGFSQVTQQPGWHTVTLDIPKTRYVDQFTSEVTPAQISLNDLEATSSPITIFNEQIEEDHPYLPFVRQHSLPVFGQCSAADGQDLHYRLTPPAVIDGTHPVVLYVYGGPGAQKVRRDWSSLLLQMFAHHGFGVLEIDNRGSTNRGRTFEAPIYRNLGSVEVEDQLHAFTILEDYEWADPARVGVFGHSYGGYMTLKCLTHTDKFKAGVAVAPVSDWALYDTHYTERYMGLPQENAQGYAESGVVKHLEQLNAPLLLMHGMADDNVLFTNTTAIMGRLQELEKAFELMTYPGAKHSMQERHVSVHRFNYILDFFTRTL